MTGAQMSERKCLERKCRFGWGAQMSGAQKSGAQMSGAQMSYNRLCNGCLNCVKLSIDNVLYVLAQAHLYDLKDWTNRCWRFVDKNASAVLKTEEFLQIGQKLLVELFSRDQLKLDYSDEISVWFAALRWADEQCNKRGVDCTANNRRELLGPALYQIRVPLIKKDDFAIISKCGLLTKDEVISVCMFHLDPSFCEDLYPLSFSSKRRA